MKVKNIHRKNRAVLVGGVLVQFDAEGVAEVEQDTLSRLTLLEGYQPVPAPAPEAAVAPAEQEGEDLEALSTAQLKKLAKGRGIDVGEATKKADLIRAIEAVRA